MKQSAILDMDAVTTINLHRKQFPNTKALAVSPATEGQLSIV
jgi:hypothetical protein